MGEAVGLNLTTLRSRLNGFYVVTQKMKRKNIIDDIRKYTMKYDNNVNVSTLFVYQTILSFSTFCLIILSNCS